MVSDDVASARRLVVTADDFGLSAAVNRGVEAAATRGIVTSASLMVRRPHAADAAERAAALADLSVGLHLELASYEVHNGHWELTEQLVDLDDDAAVARELAAQVDRFVELVGRPPAHLDSHHHLHREAPVERIVLGVAAALGIPVRGVGHWRYCGDFYGQYGRGTPWPDGVTVDALVDLIAALGPGVTELACHPADGADPAHGTYDAERVTELSTLTSPQVRAAVAAAGIELIGSDRLAQRPRGEGPIGEPSR